MNDLVGSIDQLIWEDSILPDWAATSVQRSISVDVSNNKISSVDVHILMANYVIKPHNHFNVTSFYNIANNPVECSCELLAKVRYLLEAFNVSTSHNISLVVDQVSSLLAVPCKIKQRYGTTMVPIGSLANSGMRRQLKCSDDAARCSDECFCYQDKKTGAKRADCSECDCLDELPISMPPNTSVLLLNGNFIRTFGCRRYMRDVTHLLLNNNLIDRIEPCNIRYLQNVQFLRLDANHLEHFPYQLAYLPSLTANNSINLANNSFHCDCSDDIRDAFDHFGPRLVSPYSIQCYTNDGRLHRYLDFLDTCDHVQTSSVFQRGANVGSGVHLVILIAVSAVVVVVVLICAIVVYYVCCIQYVMALRRNASSIFNRYQHPRPTSTSTSASTATLTTHLQQQQPPRQQQQQQQQSVSSGRSCFKRAANRRNQFQFHRLIADDESAVVDDAEIALAIDNSAASDQL